MFFRKQMDSVHGGISISVISGFNRLKSILAMAYPLYLAENSFETEENVESSLKYKEWLLNLLISCIQSSDYLELIQENSFVRLKQGWEYWILPLISANESNEQVEEILDDSEATQTEKTVSNVSENYQEKVFEGQKTFSNSSVLPNASSIFPTPPLSPHISKISPTSKPIFTSHPKSDDWNEISTLILMTQQPKTLAVGENVIHIPTTTQSDFLNSTETVEMINQGIFTYESNTWPQHSLKQGTRFWPQENNLGGIGWFIHPNRQDSVLEFPCGKGFQILKENKFILTDYSTYYSKAISERQSHGIGKSYKINLLYKFWSVFLPLHFNNQMYSDFCQLAVEDARSHQMIGLEHLYKFYESQKANTVFSKDYQSVLEWDKTPQRK